MTEFWAPWKRGRSEVRESVAEGGSGRKLEERARRVSKPRQTALEDDCDARRTPTATAVGIGKV